jgi:hypothetical protein
MIRKVHWERQLGIAAVALTAAYASAPAISQKAPAGRPATREPSGKPRKALLGFQRTPGAYSACSRRLRDSVAAFADHSPRPAESWSIAVWRRSRNLPSPIPRSRGRAPSDGSRGPTALPTLRDVFETTARSLAESSPDRWSRQTDRLTQTRSGRLIWINSPATLCAVV